MRLKRKYFFPFGLGLIALTGVVILIVFKQPNKGRSQIATEEESSSAPVARTMVFDGDEAPSGLHSKAVGSEGSAPVVGNSSVPDPVSTPLTENPQAEAKAPPMEPRGKHISHGGPMGTMEMSDPPERLPSTDGSPEEVIAFESIRKSMPGAYMVKKASAPPSELVTESPGE